MPLKFSVAAKPFALPLRAMLNAAASLGATAIQWDSSTELRPGSLSETGRRQFLHEMSELGLTVSSLLFPTRRPLYDADGLEARIAACRQVMEFAWQLKSRVVVLRTGKIPVDPNSREYQTLREALGDLARHSNQVGVTLAVTPTRDKAAEMKSLFDQIATGPIGVNFDPAAFLLGGESPETAFRTLHDRILAFTARDAVRDIDGGGVETAVGQGEVRFDELLALCEEAGYRSWLTIDRTQGDEKPQDIAAAIRHLKKIAFGG